MNKRTLNRGFFTGAYGLYWMGTCLTLSFAAVYLDFQHLNSTQVGIVMAASNALSVLLSLMMVKLVQIRNPHSSAVLIVIICAIQILLLLFMILSQGSVLISGILYFCLAALQLVLSPLYIELYVSLSMAAADVSFSLSRAFGSLCFAVCSFAAGFLIRLYSPALLPILTLCCISTAMLLILALMKAIPRSESGRSRAGMESGLAYCRFLRKNRRFILLLSGVFLIFLVHNALSTFTLSVVRSVGGTPSLVGYLNGVAILAEIPAMLLYPKVKKRGIGMLLAISLCCFALRTAMIALARSPAALYAAFAMQLLAFGLYTPAVVDYVSQKTAPDDAGLAQGLIATAPMFGGFVGSILFGRFLDIAPVGRVLFLACLICSAGSALSLAGLKSRTTQE